MGRFRKDAFNLSQPLESKSSQIIAFSINPVAHGKREASSSDLEVTDGEER